MDQLNEMPSGTETAFKNIPASCLHEIFRANSARHSTRLAVTDEKNEWTYHQLDGYSDAVANGLRKRGVCAGQIVALYLERSVHLVGAILGILKAGAAYLPIDSMFPKERVAWILADSESRYVITDEAHTSTLDPNCRHLLLEEVATLEVDGETRPHPQADPTQLAYVIYTSGSTGQPKGVLVEHRQITALLAQTRGLFGFDSADVWTVFHSVSFDFSVWEIFGALTTGGHAVIVPRTTARDPRAFLDLLRERRISVLNLTPSAFWPLISCEACGEVAELGSIRLIILGGERLNVGMLKPWFERHGDGRPQVVNMYGITEITVHGSYRRIGRDDLKHPDRSPIGSPLPGYRFYVRDINGCEVSCGEAGELYVAGSGVARGYLRRPSLTSDRFRAGAGIEASTLYRTGDIVLKQEDGEHFYVGRLDEQIKVRGYRIEPFEVEAYLHQNPHVARSAVEGVDFGEGDVRLVAYVVLQDPAGGEQLTHADLRAALAAHVRRGLPDYMQPSEFVFIEAMPVTNNGKIDRLSLRNLPKKTRTPLGSATMTHDRVADIWREILVLEEVPSDTDFFDIGGTSLALARVLARISTRFGVDIHPANLLDGTSVVHMASIVEVALSKHHSGGIAS